MVKTYQEPPVTAIRFTGHNLDEIAGFLGDMPLHRPLADGNPHVDTLYVIVSVVGSDYALPGDWIIRHHDGRFTSCGDEMFRAEYAEVAEAC